MDFTEKIASSVNVAIEHYDSKGKLVHKRRMQWQCEMPDELKEEAEREAAMMRVQTALKLRSGPEWVVALHEALGKNVPVMSAVAAVIWWDYVQDTTSPVWDVVLLAGRRSLRVKPKSISKGLELVGYVKPAYRAARYRHILSAVKIKINGGKIVVKEK
jgi:SOS-response transcriptional repressor LexA